MGAIGNLIHIIKDVIKIDDKIASLSERVKELSNDVRKIDARMIRLETILEIAEKQRFLARKKEKET